MNCDVQQQIIQFNRLFKRYVDIYRQAARNFDLPELSLGILYVLRENPESTQKDLADRLLHPKQSIHSALRSLVTDGYVVLKPSEDDRRSKQIQLTEKGIALAEATSDKILCAEMNTFLAFTNDERKTLLDLYERLTTALHKEMQKIK